MTPQQQIKYFGKEVLELEAQYHEPSTNPGTTDKQYFHFDKRMSFGKARYRITKYLKSIGCTQIQVEHLNTP